MSGTNPLLAQSAPAASPTPAPAPQQPAVQQGAPTPASNQPDQMGDLVAGSMRGGQQQALIARRDAAGQELQVLARVMSEPDPKPDEITDYLATLVKSGELPMSEGLQIIQSVPKDNPAALRAWAKRMFNFVMHTGIHAHAAFPRTAFPGAPQDDGAAADGEGTPS